MKTTAQRVLGCAALAGLAAVAAPAHAQFFAAICDDIGCTGGNDVIVQDNVGLDSNAAAGSIIISASLAGYSMLVDVAQSKPMVGNAAFPQLDIAFAASTSSTAATGTIFLYASDTGFTAGGPGSFRLRLDGSTSSTTGTVQGRAWGGSSNAAASFPNSPLFANSGILNGPSFSTVVNGAFTPSLSPYSLTVGVSIAGLTANPQTGGTTMTGNLGLQITPVPEPETYALMLAGLGAIGLIARRRRAG